MPKHRNNYRGRRHWKPTVIQYGPDPFLDLHFDYIETDTSENEFEGQNSPERVPERDETSHNQEGMRYHPYLNWSARVLKANLNLDFGMNICPRQYIPKRQLIKMYEEELQRTNQMTRTNEDGGSDHETNHLNTNSQSSARENDGPAVETVTETPSSFNSENNQTNHRDSMRSNHAAGPKDLDINHTESTAKTEQNPDIHNWTIEQLKRELVVLGGVNFNPKVVLPKHRLIDIYQQFANKTQSNSKKSIETVVNHFQKKQISPKATANIHQDLKMEQTSSACKIQSPYFDKTNETSTKCKSQWIHNLNEILSAMTSIVECMVGVEKMLEQKGESLERSQFQSNWTSSYQNCYSSASVNGFGMSNISTLLMSVNGNIQLVKTQLIKGNLCF